MNHSPPKQISFRNLTNQPIEGLVFLGCGGTLDSWVNGITESLLNSIQNLPFPNLRKDLSVKDILDLFSGPFELITTRGRIDLVFPFKKGNDDLNKLITFFAWWKITFGDCCWISDYRSIYDIHHHPDAPKFDVNVEETYTGRMFDSTSSSTASTSSPTASTKLNGGVGKPARSRVVRQRIRFQPHRSCKK